MARRTTHLSGTFAYTFGINRATDDDWFDPKLHQDTDLFVDPYLMFGQSDLLWTDVHERMVAFFNRALQHAAASNGRRSSADYIRAAEMLSFPEPVSFCLGYGKGTIFGSGSGGRLGRAMLRTAERAIQAGIENIDDFGELMLFGDNFGADRVSDMTCNILMDKFVAYTQTVVARHEVPTERVVLPHVGYDFTLHRWRKASLALPINPCWKPDIPVLLVPDRFLDALPKMDDVAFWDWVFSTRNQQLRTDLGLFVSDNIDRKDLIQRAKASPNLVRRFGIEYAQRYRAQPPRPYDFVNDPLLKVRPLEVAQSFLSHTRLTGPPDDPEQFCSFVDQLVADFKWMVEERGLARQFWTSGAPLSEPDVQHLFDTAVLLLCQQFDVDFTPEAGTGRGPVDYKFSAGWDRRAVVELKFAKSSSYWANLEQQPPAYMRSERITCGTIIVIQHEPQHCTPDFLESTRQVVKAAAKESSIKYKVVFVNVRVKPSASKVKRPV